MVMFIALWLVSVIAFAGLAFLSGIWLFGRDIVGAGLEAAGRQEALPWMRYNQFINQVGVFILPSLLFALIAFGRKYMAQGMGFVTTGTPLQWMLSVALMLASLPLVSNLITWNEGLSLPDTFRSVESWMRMQEDNARALSDTFLADTSLSGLMLNLLIVAIMPALGEELLFRGVLQGLLVRWTRSGHVGVLLSALLFSALHLQFFGFFPRLFLGLVLGYAMLYSADLRIPILMHLGNNALITIIAWSYARQETSFDPISFGEAVPVWVLLPAAMATLLCWWLLRRHRPHPPEGSLRDAAG